MMSAVTIGYLRSVDTEGAEIGTTPVTWRILANQFLLTPMLVGCDHFEAIESVSHGSCIAIHAVEIAQNEDVHLGPEET